MELRHGGRDEWAPEGKPKKVGEPEKILRYQKSAYDGMHERISALISSRVAPQERSDSCPGICRWDEGLF